MNAYGGEGSALGDLLYGIERLIGSRFGDTIEAGYDPHTQIYGGGGKDVLIGNPYAQKLYGGAGNDVITGFDTLYPNNGGGKDSLFGDAGDDVISAGINLDKIYGGTGKDTIYGGDGNDRIYGGKGDDWIAANRGDDAVYGGAGADTFFFSASESGERHVKDFKVAEGDKLHLAFGGRISSLAELTHLLSESNGNLIITMRNDSIGFWQVFVERATIADLSDANLIF